MSVHEQFAEDLALYALGSLQGDERIALEKHLEGCGDCRSELEQFRSDAALLALSTAGPMPPQRARQRLMNAVNREPRVPVALALQAHHSVVECSRLGGRCGDVSGGCASVEAEWGSGSANCELAVRCEHISRRSSRRRRRSSTRLPRRMRNG